MKLDLISYCVDENLASEWRLEGCRLGDINLIVGKNASGKTRILRSIELLASLLCGNTDLHPEKKRRDWTLTFDSDSENNQKIYKLITQDGKVFQEKYDVGNKNYCNRENLGEGKIWANKIGDHGDYIDFQVPTDELAALKKRDTIQHPFFEDIFEWSNSLISYQCGTDLGRNIINFPINQIKIDLTDTEQVVAIFKLGKKMTTNDRFIMNGVPLEYWSVIARKAGLAKLHNINNSREIFEDFKFTGLNNFDFFATDFYLEGFGEEEIKFIDL